MSIIPDCRTDESYNQNYLNDTDAEFIAGFDWCTKMVVENFFNNLDNYEITDGQGFDVIEYLEAHEEVAEELKNDMLQWIEGQRDELITSMIENMSDEEYDEIKVKVDAGERKNCLNTYKFLKEE